ncbi:MAG: hypothetical protein IJO64_03060 [Clostridia bacterium]|nr:hypothetical protein [Clostridia bacterium]
MKERSIVIKERSNGLISKGFMFLLLMLASLLGALMPLLVSGISDFALYFYIGGGALFVLFTVLFVVLLIKESKPKDALILNARGFIDTKNVGADIEIEWTNVASVKLIARRDNPLLGVTLENSDIVLAKMKKKQAAEMRENIEENLPTILIAQSDVRISIEELKKHFTKLARDARILEQAPQTKPKSNPFTTDDVLRAFGKLPKESNETPVEETAQSEGDEPINNTDTVTTEKQSTDPASDSFYASLYKSANVVNEENIQDNETETAEEEPKDTEYMPPEIQELLGRAKATRIAEIEKILADPNATVTHKVPSNASQQPDPSEAPAAQDNGLNTEKPQSSNDDEVTIDSLIEALPGTDELFEEVYLKPKMEPEAENQIQSTKQFSAPIPKPEPIQNTPDDDDYGFVIFDENDEDNDYSNVKHLPDDDTDSDMIFVTDIDDD